MVAEFLRGLKVNRSRYVFAIANCAHTHGATLRRIRTLLGSAGTRLSAGFVVRHDIHVLQPGGDEMVVTRLAKQLAREVPRRFADREEELAHAIASKEKHEIEVSNWTSATFGQLMHPGAMLGFKRQDKGFTADDACVSCGICTRICPRENIRLVEGRPTWSQDCEACNACILWCPQTAIRLLGHAPTEPRHHPGIALADMLLWPDVLTAST
jgi:ferredoxin